MDTKKMLEGLKQIKDAFLTSQKFAEAKLQDGTIIRYDTDVPEIGSAVTVITEQGEAPIPDGDYVMEDGTMFTTAGGLITAITPAAMPEEEATEAPAAPAAMNEGSAPGVKSIVESIIKESRFATEDMLNEKIAEITLQKESFTAQKDEVAEIKVELEKANNTIKAMFSLLEKMGEMPTATPAESKRKFDPKEYRASFKKELDELFYTEK